jgi:hypothetical protein
MGKSGAEFLNEVLHLSRNGTESWGLGALALAVSELSGIKLGISEKNLTA